MAESSVRGVVKGLAFAFALLGLAACAGLPGEQADRPAMHADAETVDPCAYDLGAMMNLTFEAFDQDMDGGWRPLASAKGCEAVAADLLETYRVDRIDQQRRGLMHHEAQLRAAANQTAEAIGLLQQSLALETAPEMVAYRNAEIAFLSGDMAGLRSARAELAAVPPPEGFEQGVAQFVKAFPDQPPPTWPINLDVVDGFITCFGASYYEAYNRTCDAAQ